MVEWLEDCQRLPVRMGAARMGFFFLRALAPRMVSEAEAMVGDGRFFEERSGSGVSPGTSMRGFSDKAIDKALRQPMPLPLRELWLNGALAVL